MTLHPRIPVQYGLLLGLAACVIGVISYAFYTALFSSFVTQSLYGIIALAIFIFLPVWGGVTYRRSRGGVIDFKEAFFAVLIICALGLFMNTVFNYLLTNIIDPQYPEQLYELVKSTTAESMEKFGATDEQIELKMKDFTIDSFKPDAISSVKGFGYNLAMAMVLSMIIALFIKRNADAVTPPPFHQETTTT